MNNEYLFCLGFYTGLASSVFIGILWRELSDAVEDSRHKYDNVRLRNILNQIEELNNKKKDDIIKIKEEVY